MCDEDTKPKLLDYKDVLGCGIIHLMTLLRAPLVLLQILNILQPENTCAFGSVKQPGPVSATK